MEREGISPHRRTVLSIITVLYPFFCHFQALKNAFGICGEHFRFGMVGLHPCGDLTPILMHLFVQCPDAKFINIVGCCYMKITTGM
jgi:hypothetical protein